MRTDFTAGSEAIQCLWGIIALLWTVALYVSGVVSSAKRSVSARLGVLIFSAAHGMDKEVSPRVSLAFVFRRQMTTGRQSNTRFRERGVACVCCDRGSRNALANAVTDLRRRPRRFYTTCLYGEIFAGLQRMTAIAAAVLVLL